MNLQTAISILGSQEKLAESLGVKQQHVSYWLNNRVPAERCRDIERATDGAVTCQMLRPDVFGEPEKAA